MGNINSNDTDVSNRNWRQRGKSISHSINKLIHFKHREKEKSQIFSEKKLTILREPILKSIGRSVYHNGNQSNQLCCNTNSTIDQKLPKDGLTSAANPKWFDKTCDQCANAPIASRGLTKRASERCAHKSECQQRNGIDTGDANNVMIHRIQHWQLDDDSTVDFKSLVNECDHLTLSTRSTSNNSIMKLHKSRNFQVLQANQIGNTVASLSGGSDTIASNNSAYAATAAGNISMNSSISSNSSNSSSCSQQARMNSSNCDVTIDELASYIEFQLHLPKPMSSNVYEAMFS